MIFKLRSYLFQPQGIQHIYEYYAVRVAHCKAGDIELVSYDLNRLIDKLCRRILGNRRDVLCHKAYLAHIYGN